MDYSRLIPEKAPEDLFECLEQEEPRFKVGVLSYKAIGFEEAEGISYCEDFGGDLRRDRKKRPALLWCSECGRESLAEWIGGETCHGYGVESGIHIEDNFFNNASGDYRNGAEMACPVCGASVRLTCASSIRQGVTTQILITVPTVCSGYPVFTVFCAERNIRGRNVSKWATPFEAYVIDGKKLIKLARYRRGMRGGWYYLGCWEQLKRARDTMTNPVMYWAEPSLDGTVLENAKLWEYKAQTYDKGNFYPLAYSRLYLRRHNVENLITAGLGDLIGSEIEDEKSVNSFGPREECKIPNIRWIDWKRAKPHEMLGVTKQEFREIREAQWGPGEWKCWADCKAAGLTPAELTAAIKALGVYGVRRIAGVPELAGHTMRTARYITKQKCTAELYLDYINMARRLGEDMTQDVILWPPHFRAAHDRAASAEKYHADAMTRENFERMTEAARGLTWKHNGIIIRPAASPEELVAEGTTLRHCVGGYAKNHASGRIILFIRHERRPERSWYTLNVDLTSKTIIQNHGYRNEMLPSGKRLHIPKEVTDFVAAWEETVLKPWTMPKMNKRKKSA